MSKHADNLILLGYAGHAYTVLDALMSSGREAMGYCDLEEKQPNPFNLGYLGQETSIEAQAVLGFNPFFVAIGDNTQRARLSNWAIENKFKEASAIVHASAVVSPSVVLPPGVLIGARAAVNALASIGRGSIINTGSIIEHECHVGEFSHIAPGAVLLGNVSIGQGVLIGANAVILPGVTIGNHAVVGAGSVVLQDLPARSRVVGNPARRLS